MCPRLHSLQARSQPSRWGWGWGGGSELGWVEHQARIQDFLKGGGGWRHSQAPPLGHCPRDVINLKNAPTLGHSQAHPPWTLPVWRHPHSKSKGGGVIGRPRSRTLCIGFAKGWNKILGMGNWGGSSDPPPPRPRPPPPPWLRAWFSTGLGGPVVEVLWVDSDPRCHLVLKQKTKL